MKLDSFHLANPTAIQAVIHSIKVCPVTVDMVPDGLDKADILCGQFLIQYLQHRTSIHAVGFQYTFPVGSCTHIESHGKQGFLSDVTVVSVFIVAELYCLICPDGLPFLP